MKNIIKGLSDSKRAEIATMAETIEHEGQQLCKVERVARGRDYVKFSNQVDGNSLVDGVIYGPVKECENGALIVKGYNVYQKAHNRTADTVEVFEVVDSGVIANRIQEKINNVEYYLCVESNYRNPTEGKGAKDAVLFQTGQIAEGKEEIDSCVIVSVDMARSFANSILQTCDEIENERPQREKKPKCTITLLEKEHLPGAFIVEVVTPECTRAIHHYSIASRAEYVDDLIRQLRLSGVSYVIINFDSLERQKARPHGNEEQAH